MTRAFAPARGEVGAHSALEDRAWLAPLGDQHADGAAIRIALVEDACKAAVALHGANQAGDLQFGGQPAGHAAR